MRSVLQDASAQAWPLPCTPARTVPCGRPAPALPSTHPRTPRPSARPHFRARRGGHDGLHDTATRAYPHTRTTTQHAARSTQQWSSANAFPNQPKPTTVVREVVGGGSAESGPWMAHAPASDTDVCGRAEHSPRQPPPAARTSPARTHHDPLRQHSPQSRHAPPPTPASSTHARPGTTRPPGAMRRDPAATIWQPQQRIPT